MKRTVLVHVRHEDGRAPSVAGVWLVQADANCFKGGLVENGGWVLRYDPTNQSGWVADGRGQEVERVELPGQVVLVPIPKGTGGSYNDVIEWGKKCVLRSLEKLGTVPGTYVVTPGSFQVEAKAGEGARDQSPPALQRVGYIQRTGKASNGRPWHNLVIDEGKHDIPTSTPVYVLHGGLREADARMHRMVKQFLTKSQQGKVMGAFRAVLGGAAADMPGQTEPRVAQRVAQDGTEGE